MCHAHIRVETWALPGAWPSSPDGSPCRTTHSLPIHTEPTVLTAGTVGTPRTRLWGDGPRRESRGVCPHRRLLGVASPDLTALQVGLPQTQRSRALGGPGLPFLRPAGSFLRACGSHPGRSPFPSRHCPLAAGRSRHVSTVPPRAPIGVCTVLRVPLPGKDCSGKPDIHVLRIFYSYR